MKYYDLIHPGFHKHLLSQYTEIGSSPLLKHIENVFSFALDTYDEELFNDLLLISINENKNELKNNRIVSLARNTLKSHLITIKDPSDIIETIKLYRRLTDNNSQLFKSSNSKQSFQTVFLLEDGRSSVNVTSPFLYSLPYGGVQEFMSGDMENFYYSSENFKNLYENLKWFNSEFDGDAKSHNDAHWVFKKLLDNFSKAESPVIQMETPDSKWKLDGTLSTPVLPKNIFEQIILLCETSVLNAAINLETKCLTSPESINNIIAESIISLLANNNNHVSKKLPQLFDVLFTLGTVNPAEILSSVLERFRNNTDKSTSVIQFFSLVEKKRLTDAINTSNNLKQKTMHAAL